ncbi:MAG: choice-of-anchor J domain-containing protein, partial [Oscillospiraceae bacterium]
MRERKFLSKALSVLLSGAMLVGAIPAASAEDYDLPLLEVETQNAEIPGHTLDGYFCVWSEDFESEGEELPSGFSTMDWNHDGNTWAKAYDSAGDFTAHCGLGCAYSQSWDSLKGALMPQDTLVLPEFYLSGAYDWKLTFMATGTGDNNAEKFMVKVNLDEGASWSNNLSDYVTTGEWQEYTYDLNDYVGHNAKIGIHHYDCTGQYALRVDCIKLWAKQVHSLEGYPANAFFDDFEGDIRPTYYLAEEGMWEILESIESHHGSKCLESLPEGTEIGVSGSNGLTLNDIVLDIGKDYALSFMVKGENAGTLKVGVVTADGKMHEFLSQTVDTDEWQEVTVDLEGFAGRTVDIHITQSASEADSMYIDCLGLWYTLAHTYGDGRTLVWSESFESSTLPSGWGTLDKDDNASNWVVEYQDSDIKKHHGIGSVYSESSRSFLGDEVPTNNWLLLQRKTLDSGKRYILTFDAVEQADADKNLAEKFGVFISTDGGENYTQLGEDYTTTDKWQEIEVDLSAYAGKTVDIAVVHHNCTDQYMLVLDCFNLWELPLKEITTIQANIAEPKIGDAPATTATFTTEPAGGLADSTEVYWQKVAEADFKGQETTGWTYLEEDEKFEAGYYYLVNMPLELNPGYKFGGTVTSKVNYYTADGNYDGTYPSIWALVPPLEIEITNIAATITEPTFGATPDTNPVVTFDPENSAYIDYVYWQKIAKADYTGTSDDEWLAMAATEKFEAGYIYSVEISMSTEDGYKVGDKCTGTINGKPHDDYWGPFIDDLYGPCLFMRFEPKTAVTSISVAIDTPIIGETLDFAPDFTSAPANSVELEYISWCRILKEEYTGTVADKWKIVSEAEKVEAGYYYSPTLRLSTKDGFAITPDTVGTINGRPHVDTFGGVYTSSSQAFLTVGFDPEKPNPVATPGDGEVTLNWTVLAGATKYAVYSYIDGKFYAVGTTTETTYTVTGLTNGTKTGFLVRACIDGVWTSYTSDYIVYATPVASTKPIVTATPGDGKVTLSWKSPAGASKFAVYTYIDGKYYAKGTTTETTYTVDGLTNGTKTGFLVRAYVDGDWSSFTTDDVVYATPITTKPKVTATPGDGQVTLSWTVPTGATKYTVFTYIDGKYYTKGTTTATTYTVTGLTNGTKIGFLVRAYVDGAWSSFTSADVVYATPVASKPKVTATPGDSEVTLNWTVPTGATKYGVYTYLDGKYYAKGTTTATTYTVTGLT